MGKRLWFFSMEQAVDPGSLQKENFGGCRRALGRNALLGSGMDATARRSGGANVKVGAGVVSRAIPDFIPKDLWPPHSPDLNPMDFSVWAVLEAKACRKKERSLESLKAALTRAWDDLGEDYLRPTVESAVKRMRALFALGAVISSEIF